MTMLPSRLTGINMPNNDKCHNTFSDYRGYFDYPNLPMMTKDAYLAIDNKVIISRGSLYNLPFYIHLAYCMLIKSNFQH